MAINTNLDKADTYFQVYSRLCMYCPDETYCHIHCTECDRFMDLLERWEQDDG